MKDKRNTNCGTQCYCCEGASLCGEELFADEEAAVYRRSPAALPDCLVAGDGQDGLVFSGGRFAGNIGIPFVLVEHGRDDGTEETDVMEVVQRIAQKADGRAADGLLLALEDKWNTTPADRWYPVIGSLLRQLCRYDHLREHFRLRRPYLVSAGQIDEEDPDQAGKRRIALEWLAHNPRRQLVNGLFQMLGVPCLEAVCCANDGYAGTEFEGEDIWG